ncbi:hypothetical protein LOTGIDRAFT_205996 [Lottia gigantea]|uniref:long-chain-fatty-acid--CoA ligase n=1 Tax=Lottia gigantea TaxID=225164 RepID=V4CRB9_LOTGI|nr:hypothetical protein LOTGIDRAFT_205996 [Lottia gigantea]ESP05040.1 hypothetical protein LOTGIDRAFT_205996 [Lottia gigantea]
MYSNQYLWSWQFTWIVLKTLPRDFRGLMFLIKMKLDISHYNKSNFTIGKIFESLVKKHPAKPCFICEDTTWTYQDVDNITNRIGNYFYEAGYRKGDMVALFMENRPEYVCIWLGLSKIGVSAALINFNQRDMALVHSINVSNARAVIFGGELSQAIKDVLPQLSKTIQLYHSGPLNTNDITPVDLDAALVRTSSFPPPKVQQSFKDCLFYIYTSGTTGLPKAAVVSHTRYYYMTMGVRFFFKITGEDVLYDTLPLYHTAGGILGTGQAVLGGTTLVIRKKFSASQFWNDCIKYNCTVAQYIGEICRYLLAQPEKQTDLHHKVRLMFGNGLRPQIWREFQERFGVEVMGEFYGATEGNCNIINFENKVGAVGFLTRILPFLYPVTLIRVNEQTGEPLRDRNGLCIFAKPGEAGELVGKIVKGNPLREFDGYANKSASQKKIVYDVYRRGDSGFLTGDVLSMDQYGYMYFRDRTGDTFRWRGENVSTSEVEAVIHNIVKLQDAVCYGVEIPGIEGRAGMAAIVDENNTVDVNVIAEGLKRSLPPYARPVFLRLTKSVSMTGTFKLKKVDLKKEGFNPEVKDKIFYLDSKSGRYEQVTPAVYHGICSHKIRL